MKIVTIRAARNHLTELARTVEAGETIVVTRNGRPIFDLVPHRAPRGLNMAAVAAFRELHGITAPVAIPSDFDDPLPEDFLITTVPPEA